MEKTGLMYRKFLDEYVSEDAVRKYTTETAGYGITHLLRNDYARIYIDVVDSPFACWRHGLSGFWSSAVAEE